MTDENGSAVATMDADPAPLSQVLGNLSPQAPRPAAVSCQISDSERLMRERMGRAHQAWEDVRRQVGRRYDGVSLEVFAVSEPAQDAAVLTLREYLAAISDRIDQGEGLLLIGPKGTGKDHLAIACLREAAKAGFITKAEDGQSLFQRFRDGMNTDASEKDAVKSYTYPDVLLLSDPIPQTGAASDYQRTILWRIIDRRYRDLKPTWVTLNVANGAEAEARLGPQIVDRLRDGATVVKCEWKSYRKASGG